ncbi:MAG TPA: HipA domain-containing protein [Polyangiaceae bacterium]|nr:HipA domain-containing protein [Polyangiaceae bacterium]
MQSLPIYFSDARVGELSHDHGRLKLGYERADVPSISRRLLAREAAYGDEESRAFIANLLPEGDWRGILCRRLALPTSDDFGLLRQLGHDCAGAVWFEEPEAELATSQYCPLDEGELRRWLRDPLQRPSPENAPGLRRALAGAQDKLILHVAEGAAYLCERGAPSTVILKPDIVGGFNGVELTALNELFCMQLARAVGLRAPKSFWFAGAYAVERFDRVLRGSRLSRLHQEDFAQLLGVLPAAKYDVGWPECFALVDQHLPNPQAARRELVERLLFNLLVGNADAHCKNFALLFGPAGAALAPVYDVLCTQVYPSLSDSFVMKLGPARRQSELGPAAWQELAQQARLPLDWIKQRGAELSSAVQLALRDLGPQILGQNPQLAADISPARRRDDLLRKLADVMVGNCKRVARSLLARA